jgi:peroxiredoxin
MKKQAGVWFVLFFLLLTAGIVYALSTTAPPSQSVSGAESPTDAGQTPPPVVAAGSASPDASLSPDLSKVDAYQFLDPVPVGKVAPNFIAKTAEGKTLRLADFKSKKNLVLVFYQGSFCSVCGAQLTNLQKHIGDFKNQNAEIIAISADDAAHAMQSVGEHGLTFPVIPDQEKKIIDQFGVANMRKKGIAWPSLFVVDQKGVVRLSFASKEGHRMHSNEILPVLSKMTGKPAPVLGYDE